MSKIALSTNTMKHWIAPRSKVANKGEFGHVLIIGGDYGMPGAVSIAGMGAAFMGAGLITVITRPEHITAVLSNRPELLCYGLKSSQTQLLKHLLAKASMIILGPGLGESNWSRWLFKTTLQYIRTHQTPCLIDADGLNWISKTNWVSQPSCIFTPHPGEAARLLACSVETIQSNRTDAIKKLQKKLGGVIVLKGAESLVYTAEEAVHICHAGNPGMASGGMGDLLSGIIAGLITQGLTPWQAAQMGVLLHAQAGDAALEKLGGPGLLASDLLPELKPLLRRQLNHLII
jgi:ADP-dependent NAD(P)H-hydrate dehydratase / NAD(P)H-hydrate epimerase